MSKELLQLNDNNFQSIKKFVACKNCQYYENEKCTNKDNCFWLDLERKLKALEIIKDLIEVHYDENRHYITLKNHEISIVICPKEKCDLLKEVLL